MLQLPAVLAVVANTCQRPSTRTTVGSFTDTIGWVASCLATMSGPVDVHRNDPGNPESTGGAPAVPVVPAVPGAGGPRRRVRRRDPWRTRRRPAPSSRRRIIVARDHLLVRK